MGVLLVLVLLLDAGWSEGWQTTISCSAFTLFSETSDCCCHNVIINIRLPLSVLLLFTHCTGFSCS